MRCGCRWRLLWRTALLPLGRLRRPSRLKPLIQGRGMPDEYGLFAVEWNAEPVALIEVANVLTAFGNLSTVRHRSRFCGTGLASRCRKSDTAHVRASCPAGLYPLWAEPCVGAFGLTGLRPATPTRTAPSTHIGVWARSDISEALQGVAPCPKRSSRTHPACRSNASFTPKRYAHDLAI